MNIAQLILACYLLLCVSAVAEAQKAKTPKPQKQNSPAATEREVREFYDSYAEDLRRHRREAIADRYDPRGVFFLGHGGKTLRSFEATKNRYQTKWAGPKSFEWKDISVEVLSPDAAVVVGRFDWQTDTGQVLTYSYTGLLIKHSGRWRIRVEDESTQPPKPPAQ
jgi:ketosteroid isomerase-like protein